jgi:hypothetical protein
LEKWSPAKIHIAKGSGFTPAASRKRICLRSGIVRIVKGKERRRGIQHHADILSIRTALPHDVSIYSMVINRELGKSLVMFLRFFSLSHFPFHLLCLYNHPFLFFYPFGASHVEAHDHHEDEQDEED